MGTTLAEKVWADHLVRKGSDGAPDLLYIDLMLMHEVTSPQAFEGLRLAGRKPRHLDQLIATEDHNTPTADIDRPNPDKISALQLSTLEKNCKDFGVRLCPLGDADQGVVHAFAPVLGLTQPGMTIVCGDSHTSTHGAFGAMAIGIGTSEVEHVMATQTLSLKPFKTMAVNIEGELPKGVTAKDIILAIIAKIGTGGGQGHVIEYRGEAIKKLSMDARMTICNMSIEAGARAGMIAPDEVTFEYLKGRPHAPEGEMWDKAIEYWKTLKTDDDAVFDKEVTIKAEDHRGRACHCLHGLDVGHAHQRHCRGYRVHRLLHQRTSRGSACGRFHYEGASQGRKHSPRARGAGLLSRAFAGGKGRT